MTIDLKHLKAVRTIISHENCPDGIASAILLKDALPLAQVKFVQHGTEAFRSLPAERNMLFCDCSPPKERLVEFLGCEAIVLDHHIASKDVVRAFGENGVFADEKLEPGVCGSVLAYRHVWNQIRQASPADSYRAQIFAELAGVRDTWQRSSLSWDQACAQSESLHFWGADRLLKIADPFGAGYEELHEKCKIGWVLNEKKAESVKRALDRAWRMTTPKGTRLVIFEGIHLSSDAAEMVGEEADLILAFGYEVEDGWHKIICSSRSHTTYDCAALAKKWHGGGHTKAAGFSEKFLYEDPFTAPNPYAHVLSFVLGFEGS
jgi:oligoribonuclease NrnB/cAMP/cGMP phosphodiesterase (DHH superfamily)